MAGTNLFGQPYFGQYYAPGIQFDASSNSGYQAASASYNWSHTIGTGANQVLVVSVGLLSAVNSVTNLTYNSVALTKLRSDVSVSTTVRTEIWYLVAPAVGAHSIAITLNTASVSASDAASYNNVDQTTPADAQNGGTGITGAGGGSSSIATVTDTNGAWLVDAIATVDTSINAHVPQTERNNVSGVAGSSGQSEQAPNVVGGTSVTMQWDNIAALTTWTMSTMALRPFLGGGIETADTATVTDSIGIVVESFINKSDSSTVTDSVSMTQVHQVNANDTSALTESIGRLVTSFVNINDTSGVTDSTPLLIPALPVNVNDTSGVTDSLLGLATSFINVSDASSITDTPSLLIPTLYVAVNDTSSVTDSVEVTRVVPGAVNVSDDVLVADSVVVSIRTMVAHSITLLDGRTGYLLGNSLYLLSDGQVALKYANLLIADDSIALKLSNNLYVSLNK